MMRSLVDRFHLILFTGFSLLVVFNILSIILLLHETHWVGPVQDFWGSIPFIEKTFDSGAWFGRDLWIAQNNHRLVLPRLAFLIDYQYFNGSNYFLTALGIVLVFTQALILLVILAPISLPGIKKALLILIALSIITLPVIAYNLVHTFNSQWIQCATLALISCSLFARGLESGSHSFLIAGLVAAILCQFTTFTLTAIWPALFYLLWHYQATCSRWLAILAVAGIFGFSFLFMLPTENVPGGRYEIVSLISQLNLSQGFLVVTTIAAYITNYLSIPSSTAGNTFSQTLTVISFAWLVIQCLKPAVNIRNHAISSLMSVMIFCICLAITTAIGRAYMGDIGSGPRFGPIVLLYWMAFIIHLLLCALLSSHNNGFRVISLISLCVLGLAGIGQAMAIGKRLSEDHNRFSLSQMAQLVNNLERNALYENMVPEWRETSYPGILNAVPFLRNHQKGIFSTPVYQMIENNKKIQTPSTACGEGVLQQKPRSQDPLIRQVMITTNDLARNHNNYLLVLDDGIVIAVLFLRRESPLKKQAMIGQSVWIGISKNPIISEKIRVIQFKPDKNICEIILKR